MKSRSHRLPILETHNDDWGDGSWTVDCICGVNFDDGEEMVDCDECGVWVHTRCSRYVKSERSFACDKCKTKDVGGSTRNANEETEVAEFLVELPTKTLRMDNPSSLFNDQNEAAVSSGKPCRLWVPMEERVHVQGVPGGEPGLFSGSGMSSIFGPELWKATGYVPKKFNFHYNEFPQWDDDKKSEENGKEVDRGKDEGPTSHADNGAGVLLSLSKNCGNGLPAPMVDSVGVKSPDEDKDRLEIVSPRHRKMLNGKFSTGSEESSKKKSSSKQAILLYSGKHKKEELGMSKDQIFKKRERALEQEENVNKQTTRASRSDGGSKVSSDVLADKPSDGLGECATNLASNECGPEATRRNNVSSNNTPGERNRGDHAPGRFDNFTKGRRSVAAALESARKAPTNEEAPGNGLQSCGNTGGAGSIGVESHDKELATADVTITGPDTNETEDGQDLNTDEANTRPVKKLKAGADADDSGSLPVQSFPTDDVKLDISKGPAHSSELSADLSKEDSKGNPASVIKLEASQHKVHDGSRNPVVTNSKTDKSNGTPETNGQHKPERTVSGGSVEAKKRPSIRTDSSEVAEESPRSNSAVTPALYHRKVVVSVGKSSSTSTSNIPKSSINRVTASAQKPSTSRQKELAGNPVRTMKTSSSVETIKDDNKHGPLKKLLKESSRLNSESKLSNATKPSSTSDSKKMLSDIKDSRIHSSSKASAVSSGSATQSESACPQQVDSASNVQNKDTVPVIHSKGEKFLQPSSRGNAPSMNAPAAALSDEELALLLHQELNSSPRVPRVPRMRNAGSLPQLPGATGTSMLMKRTSSGGKEHVMTSRRKNKEASRDGAHGSPEADDEPKKMNKKPSSPNKRKRDSGIERVSRREADGPKKTTIASSPLSSSSNEANVQSAPSSRPSSRNIPDDDSPLVGRKENRTLPGLLAEIMREGKRMTYEELCNAVLPHWPHLRKHNGERYAYSSHSQAVLDCLRNRSEWARLIDRGPKTTPTRKRRKTDTDSVSFESEDDEDNTKEVGTKSVESHQEDVIPKGKRKARKGRRLALQGRGVVRRRRVVSDDESESPSNSDEDEVNSSEEEIQGGATGSEDSASSDED